MPERKARSSAIFKRIIKIEKAETFKDSVKAAFDTISPLQNACDAKMEDAVVGVLTNVLVFVEGSLEKQRAIYRAGTIANAIRYSKHTYTQNLFCKLLFIFLLNILFVYLVFAQLILQTHPRGDGPIRLCL